MQASAGSEPKLGQVLRAARQRAGLTVADTATRAGISPSHLSNIESARRTPSLPVARALDVVLALTGPERARLADSVIPPLRTPPHLGPGAPRK